MDFIVSYSENRNKKRGCQLAENDVAKNDNASKKKMQ